MNYLLLTVGIVFLFSCNSNSNSETTKHPIEAKRIKMTGRFLTIDSIEFKPEESTDYIIFYKDSNELKNIRDSIYNHH